MVLWSKSSILDREIRGSNLGGGQNPQKFFHQKMMPRILSYPKSDRDRKAEEISRKNGRAEGAQVGGISNFDFKYNHLQTSPNKLHYQFIQEFNMNMPNLFASTLKLNHEEFTQIYDYFK